MQYLDASEISVWEAYLDDPNLQEHSAILSQDEHERADRFVYAVHGKRFTARRAILRLLLAEYLGRPADGIRFEYGPQGKPALPGRELHFNLSHSDDRALFSFSAEPHGVDIERLRLVKDLTGLADRFFSRDEADAVREMPAERRTERFFEIWTLKEAYLKASGEGLSRPLDSFSVSDAIAKGLAPMRDPIAVDSWALYRLEAQDNCLAALAAPLGKRRVRCESWPGG